MKFIKKILLICLCFSSVFAISCGGGGSQGGGDSEPPKVDPTCAVSPVAYEQVNSRKDMDVFLAENGDDLKKDYGFVKGIWHKLTVGGKNVEVYSARCGKNVHSFAWVDVDTKAPDGEFNLDVSLKILDKSKETVTVLPEKLGVETQFADSTVTCTLHKYGSYSFVFDEEADKALTLYVAPLSTLEIPEGYSKVDIEPGTYEREDTTFIQENTVYNFKSGVYDITAISVPSNSILYFERGTYIRVYEAFDFDYYGALTLTNVQNTKIAGRAIFDYSNCLGGEAKTKGAYTISRSNNVEVEGIITINSHNWTMCVNYSKNVKISRCMFFSYRTFSDGIMMSDCQDSTATDNFVRTGDDAIEVKSFTSIDADDCYTKNIVYENNCVWTDKGIAYGLIYEAIHDAGDVYFRNNSVGFAQAAWSEHLGCCTMQMGSNKDSVWSNVHFEDMEVYSASCALLSVFNRAVNSKEGGTIKNIYFKNITLKYARKTQRDVYCLSVVMRKGEGVPVSNCKISGLYLDNINFAGVAITADNIDDYKNVALDDGFKFLKSAIKVNTNPSV